MTSGSGRDRNRPASDPDASHSGSTRLGALAALCSELAGTPGRRRKVALAGGFLRSVTAAEVPWAVAFLLGRPFPASDPRTLDLRWATLGALRARVELAAPSGPALTLLDVARAFETVAAAAGPGSRAGKLAAVLALFARAPGPERDVLERIVAGEMRLGLSEGLMEEAIALGAGVDPGLVRRAALLVSDPSVVAGVALADGEAGLRRLGLRLFVPLSPMLAEPMADVAEALRVQGSRTALEFKYDGARVQLHKLGDTVRIWSRRLSEVTASVPDVAELARRTIRAEACVLDGEVVAVSRDGRPRPFQELLRRFGRVHEVEAGVAGVPLALYLFDCLWADGRSLLDEPYRTRWETLAALVPASCLARRRVVEEPAAARAFLAEALAAGHEGVLAKTLDSPYVPGSRGRRWLKIKTAETLDCVIVAADRGSGRRRGWLSNYHLAVRDETGGLALVGKTFKGLTDAEFRAMTERLRGLELDDDGYTVTVRPEVVVEVAYGEIQRSPRYASGVALRFARILRIRDDKAPGEVAALADLRALHAWRLGAEGEALP